MRGLQCVACDAARVYYPLNEVVRTVTNTAVLIMQKQRADLCVYALDGSTSTSSVFKNSYCKSNEYMFLFATSEVSCWVRRKKVDGGQ